MTTVDETRTLAVAWAGGILLGVVFFGVLWWTVCKGVQSKHPAVWFVGSLLARLCIAFSGLAFVSGGHWERLLSCLLGFSMASLLVSRWSFAHEQRSERLRHAPHSR